MSALSEACRRFDDMHMPVRSAVQPVGPKLSVLIADDHPDIRKLCRIVLSRRFVIDEADTAISAFEKIVNDRPWAVVLDIRMPGRMTGWDLCRYLKQDAQYRSTKVVIVSGSLELSDHQVRGEFGPDAVFEKPFQAEAILRFLEGECGC